MGKIAVRSAGRGRISLSLKVCCGASLFFALAYAVAEQVVPGWRLLVAGKGNASSPGDRKPGIDRILEVVPGNPLSFRPGPGRLLLATSAEVRDVLRNEVLYKIPFEGIGWGYVVFSPDGKLVASAASLDRKVSGADPCYELRLRDAASGKSLRLLHRGFKHSWGGVTFSPDSRFLAESCGDDVFLWDLDTGKELWRLHHEGGFIKGMTYHPDGKLLVSETHEGLHFWDVEKGQLLTTLTPGNERGFHAPVISPDGKLLAAVESRLIHRKDVYGGYEIHAAIRLWELPSRKEVALLPESKGPIKKIAFRRNGRWLASVGGDKTVKIWDTPNRKLLYSLPLDSEGVDVAFSPDDRWLATAETRRVTLWDLVPDPQ